jgi:DNA-binding protein YbaB
MDRLEAVLATIREQAEQAERQIDKSQQLASETARLRVSAESAPKEVRVTVDGIGQMVDIEFLAPLHSLEPDLLRTRVLEAHRTAKARLTNVVARLSEDILGPNSASAATIVSGYEQNFGREEER